MVTVEQIEEEIEKIKNATDKLRESVENFNSVYASVHDVVDGLRIVANTNGGHRKADKIATLADFGISTKKMDNIVRTAEDVKVVYTKREVTLS
ncbi:hypothetical protein EGP98_02930 [bacterium]|nr:hypothetical protein [bacterium]